jgi:uncharacterized membrane protein YgcG
VAERLRQAAVEGRILAHELEDRVATALRARTYGDLDAVVSDLPSERVTKRPTRSRELFAAHPLALVAAVSVIAVMAFALIAVVLAAASGIWVLLVLLAVFHRGGRHGVRYSRRSEYGRGARGSRSGASIR